MESMEFPPRSKCRVNFPPFTATSAPASTWLQQTCKRAPWCGVGYTGIPQPTSMHLIQASAAAFSSHTAPHRDKQDHSYTALLLPASLAASLFSCTHQPLKLRHCLEQVCNQTIVCHLQANTQQRCRRVRPGLACYLSPGVEAEGKQGMRERELWP